jgi:Domain of unknown function (DUF1840)
MIYEFKCRATGPLVMTQAVAERLLEIIGKSAGPKGIIAVDAMPAAITALDLASQQSKAQDREIKDSDSGKTERDDPQAQPSVTIAQRAFPLIAMLKAALAAQKDITWGV